MPEGDSLIRTHLDDLQSEMEAGSRKLVGIADNAKDIREQLWVNQIEQARLAGGLVRRITELRRCVDQQLDIMRDLRRAIVARRSKVAR